MKHVFTAGSVVHPTRGLSPHSAELENLRVLSDRRGREAYARLSGSVDLWVATTKWVVVEAPDPKGSNLVTVEDASGRRFAVFPFLLTPAETSFTHTPT